MGDESAREKDNKQGAGGWASTGLLDRFPDVEIQDSLGDPVLTVLPRDWPDLAVALRDAGFEMLTDLCGVDYLDYPSGAARAGCRFEVVVNLLSFSRRERLRIRIPLEADNPSCPTVTRVWPGADWYEREAFDMFGIDFTGHPDMTRILMPDDWEGHPLRKDFAVGAIPVQFAENPKPL